MGPPSLPVRVEDQERDEEIPQQDQEQVFVQGLQDVRFHAYVRSMQRIILFETKTVKKWKYIAFQQYFTSLDLLQRYYIVGSNEQENRFRILKLDRCDPRRLVLLPEARASSIREIKSILATIEGANSGGADAGSSSSSTSGHKGINKVLSAYGIAGLSLRNSYTMRLNLTMLNQPQIPLILGFVRFLEGYYVIFVVRRLKCAMIGLHSVYKIEETKSVYIPNAEHRQGHADEARYSKMFASMDLTANFYYSYSYDLTNTLQHNMSEPKRVLGKGVD